MLTVFFLSVELGQNVSDLSPVETSLGSTPRAGSDLRVEGESTIALQKAPS